MAALLETILKASESGQFHEHMLLLGSLLYHQCFSLLYSYCSSNTFIAIVPTYVSSPMAPPHQATCLVAEESKVVAFMKGL